MKRALLLLSAMFLTTSLFAADPADHPIVGRYPDASIQHQEVSNFGQYTILVGDGETETVQGEVWMTLYAAPGDSSTFSVYSTYMDFLQAEGFTILVSCEPGHCGGSTLADAYHRAPFANDGNMNFSAPITTGTYSAGCYISAKRERGGSIIYVSIAIAAGWYDFPQYKLDVVEVASNTASIVSTGTRDTTPVVDAAAAVQTGTAGEAGTAGTAFFSDTGSLRAQAGFAAFAFADPDFAGGLVEYVDLGGTVVTMGGYRNLYGPYGAVSWYPNQNLGFTGDFSFVATESDTKIGDITFRHDAELMFFRAGAVVRMVGDAFPATIGLGFGGGVCLVTIYDSWSADDGTGQWFVAEDFFPVIHCSAELTIPVVSIGRVSAGFEYLFVPTGSLTFQHDGGSDYSIEHHEPNLGGFMLRVGLVAEL